MQGKKSVRKSGKRFFNPLELSHFMMQRSSSAPLQSKKHNTQSGNIFFALFGAVALVGVVGAGTMAIMRGPLSTMVEVQNRTQAESEMAIASRLSLLEATELAASGDCDGDGFVEPLEWTDAGGNGPLGGGGFLPSEVSSARQDPWGTDYGYCAWDAGNVLDFPGTGYPDSCDNGGGSSDGDYNRLAGNGSATDDTYTIVALISAGANQQFETTCSGGATPDVAKGGDDIVVEYTYETAVTATNGLWNIKSGEPGVAEINKEIEVAGNIDLSRGGVGTGQLQLGAGSMIYPDQTVLSVCPGASNVNVGLLRMNTSTTPYRLEICDASGWVSSGGTGVWTGGTGNDIYYNVGTPEVGIGTATPSHTLEVVGTFDNSGAVTFGSTLDVTGATTLADLTATGAVDFDSTLNVDGATTLTATTVTTLNATDAVDFDSTLNVDGATTLADTTVTTLNATGAVDFDATLNVDDASTFGGTIDAQADIANSTGSVSFNDDVVIAGTLDAQGAISNSGGNVSISDDLDVVGDLDVNGDGDFDGTLEADDYTYGGVDFTPDADCDDATEKVVWNASTGWGCADDENDGSGVGAGTTVAGVFEVDESATPDLIRMKTAVGTGYGDMNFVFGSPQMADDGDATHDSRMLFDKSKGAFRAGSVDDNSWDSASLGAGSVGFGINNLASGNYSSVFGYRASVSGKGSVAFGLTETSNNPTTRPIVSADHSFGVFMGNQNNYNLNVANRFGIVGGDLMVDDGVGTSAKGCIRYNGTSSKLEFSDDCTTFSTLTSLGTPGGASTQVQYNKSGVFAGDAGMTYDDASDTLTVGRAVIISGQTGSAPAYMNLGDLGDVSAATPADNECLVYDDASSTWVNGSCAAGGGLWTDNTTHITRSNFHVLNTGETMTSAGFDGTDYDGLIWHTDKKALRFGDIEATTAWNEAKIGEFSFAGGRNSTASGDFSFAAGWQAQATNDTSIALGSQAVASGFNSVALGRTAKANGQRSFAFGLGEAAGAHPIVSANQSLGIFMGDQSGYDLTTANRMALVGGHFMIDDAGATGSQGCIRYDGTNSRLEFSNDCTTYTTFTSLAGGLWTDNTTHITRSNFHVLNTGETMTSAGFDGASASGMIYHADKQALRIGNVNGVQWNEANIGTESLAVGVNSRASGSESFALAGGTASAAGTLAIGYNVTASGSGATGIGASSVAQGGNSFALGRYVNVTGQGSFAAGNEVDISGAASFALGLGDSTGADPIVSAGGSAAIFMGDNGGYNMSVANRFALVGGHFMVDDAGATGSQGCIRYDGTNSRLEFSNDCTTYTTFTSLAGGLWTDNTTHITRENFHIINTGETSTTAGLDGNGTRAFYDPNKGALRGGTMAGGGTGWADANIGANSFAWGWGTRATGDNSFAVGNDARATSNNSTAIGSGASSSGGHSIALMSSSTASGYAGFAVGYGTVASGNGSRAIGGSSTASGQDSMLYGKGLTASGQDSFALGRKARATGLRSYAFGVGDASDPYPQVSATDSLGIFIGDQTGYNLATANRMALVGGDFLIDDAGATGSQGCIRYDGTNSKLQYSHDCTTYADMGSSSSEIFQVTGAAGSELVSAVNATAPYATSDFVFGSPQLAGDANADHHSRMFFDKSKGAFRAGREEGTGWDNANVGTYSVALGYYPTASSYASIAIGRGANASGTESTAIGSLASASGAYATSVGRWLYATGANSIALGNRVSATGTYSGAIGLGAPSGAVPIVSGANSLGIILGDQSGYNLSVANRMGLVGGDFLIDDAGATGSQGCIRYDGANSKLQYSHDCTTYADMGSSSSEIFQVTGAAGSELVSAVNATTPYATSDFVFGSPQLADDGDADHDRRMFFDKSKGAFRAGRAQGTSWDNANVGDGSTGFGNDVTVSGGSGFAAGSNLTVSGNAAAALGYGNTASGDRSFVTGYGSNATQWSSVAMGGSVSSSGNASIALGESVSVSGANSMGVGLGAAAGARPIVSAANSFGIFMGDQSGYTLATTNRMGLVGGHFMIDDAGATGSQGCIRYNGTDSELEYSDDCTTYTPFGDLAGGLWTDNTTHITRESFHIINTGATSTTAGLDGNGTRVFYDPNKGALRGGAISSSNNAWQNANIGTNSFAWGENTKATAPASVALTARSTASGSGAVAAGVDTTASGFRAFAFGLETTASGNHAAAFGLGDPTGANPTVSGDSSFGIFMGNQGGITLAQDNTMAVLGGDFIVGSYQLDDTTTGNQDMRMFFDVSKGAFRAGDAPGTEWDDASVGISSFAAGQSTTASGDYSVALGTNTTASSNSSFAMGENSVASNSYSVAFGENATSSGYASFAGGESPTASGNNAFSYGINTVASGDYSVALGQDNSAVGVSSFVAGFNSSTATFYDIAMGNAAIAGGGTSIALGSDVTAYGANSIAIGQKVIVGQNGGPFGANSMAIGLGEATAGKPEVQGNNSLGIFMGDQSGTIIAQDNTMAIVGGSVGIGVIAPNVALDVEGDIEYTGTITDVSDRRLKDNIEPLDKTGSLLERLDQINTYSFTMKNDESSRIEYGVMAQELETIFPELVHTAKDEMGTKSVNYIGLIAPMIEATKELKAQNDMLKTAQIKTDATLQDLSAQVAVLNKAAGNNVNKASMEGYWMLILGLLGGMGLMLVIQRKKSS